MKKIVIDNIVFDYEIGCRLLKTKHGDKPFPGLGDVWNELKEFTFQEIALTFQNIEERRVAINCFGIEKIYKNNNCELISSVTLNKKMSYIDVNGVKQSRDYEDTYELYRVPAEFWAEGLKVHSNDAHFVKCKDTSTNRDYLIWVDMRSILNVLFNSDEYVNPTMEDITAIDAIAWTIRTDVPKGKIKSIIRQGDCVLIEVDEDMVNKVWARHLTAKEYKELLTLES